jgi:CheY-like chemotaxis protein
MTKILLVEDDKSLREIYGVRLLAEGYEIVSAGDGEEALALAIKERPQLIVSDVMMPKISGFDMLDILRSTTETKDIRVIMMTALSSEDQRARGESLGADRYLVKSQVGIEDVVRTVHEVLGDGLAPAPTPAQTFGTPAPSAIARPPAPVAPRPIDPALATPIPQPVMAAPVPTPMTPSPMAAQPIAPPVINSSPAAPVAFNPLPQPTAPFSSSGPASLADRVITPLTNQPAPVDVGNLMAAELSGAGIQPPVAQPMPLPPAAPPTPPTPQTYQ